MNLVPRNQIFDFDSIFNDFFQGFGRPTLTQSGKDPIAGMRVDVHEADENYEIHAELPGVKREDIEITLNNDVLTVSASKNTESEKKEKGRVIYRERSSGSISRSFSVSPGTTEADITANFSDGVLKITVPRRKEAETQASRRIEVK